MNRSSATVAVPAASRAWRLPALLLVLAAWLVYHTLAARLPLAQWPGVVFSGGLDGHLRAYASATGKILWDINTKQEYPTVNGVKAHGGSMDGPGAVVVGRTVFVNSGYTFLASAPGNVLLAFSVPKE